MPQLRLANETSGRWRLRYPNVCRRAGRCRREPFHAPVWYCGRRIATWRSPRSRPRSVCGLGSWCIPSLSWLRADNSQVPAHAQEGNHAMTDSLFAGLKVIDCASWIAGPAAATILSDFGADVIKIEPPGAGDPWRASTPVPGKADRLLLAVDVPQQAQPRHRPEACRRSCRAVSTARMDGCFRHQLSASGARAPEDRRLASAAAQPAADLRLALCLRRAGRGSRENGLQLHRLLGPHGLDGHGAGHAEYRAGAFRAWHGRPPQRAPDCMPRS